MDDLQSATCFPLELPGSNLKSISSGLKEKTLRFHGPDHIPARFATGQSIKNTVCSPQLTHGYAISSWKEIYGSPDHLPRGVRSFSTQTSRSFGGSWCFLNETGALSQGCFTVLHLQNSCLVLEHRRKVAVRPVQKKK